jgi:hypothetical protein
VTLLAFRNRHELLGAITIGVTSGRRRDSAVADEEIVKRCFAPGVRDTRCRVETVPDHLVSRNDGARRRPVFAAGPVVVHERLLATRHVNTRPVATTRRDEHHHPNDVSHGDHHLTRPR